MAHPVGYARQLVRQLPKDPATILLEKRSYRDETFITVYLEHCDELIFRDPWAGLRTARAAPELALAFAATVTPGTGAQRKRSLAVRSFATLGSACRATDRFQEANSAYGKALKMIRSGEIPAVEQANVSYRLAVLRNCQEKCREALKLVEHAVTIFRKAEHPSLGDALAVQGYILNEARAFPQAISCLREALELSWPRRKSPAAKRVCHAACHELLYAAAHSPRPDDLAKVLSVAGRARAKIGRRCRNSPFRAQLDWIAGKAAFRLGSTRMAERKYERARLELIRLKLPFHLAVLALDISLLYRNEGRWPELRELASTTYQYFRNLSGSSAAVTALSLWLDAVRAERLPNALVEDIQRQLQAQRNYRASG